MQRKEKNMNEEIQDQTKELKMQFLVLRASGDTFKTIAKKLDVPIPELIEWSRELKEALGNMKAILFEEKESATYTKRSKRIEALQVIAERLKDEIAGRDLTGVPTDKLISLFSKLTSDLKEDEQQIRFEHTKTVHFDPLDENFDSTTKEVWSA